MFVDITKRKKFQTLLDNLAETAEAQWGLMKPQHMIEHLAVSMQISNGKKPLGQRVTDEQAEKAKASFIYTDVGMEKGLKTPMLPEIPGAFKFPTMNAAKQELTVELDDFENYFNLHPIATFIHPRFGHLDYNEWVIVHNKHFTHHFKQFGLI